MICRVVKLTFPDGRELVALAADTVDDSNPSNASAVVVDISYPVAVGAHLPLALALADAMAGLRTPLH